MAWDTSRKILSRPGENAGLMRLGEYGRSFVSGHGQRLNSCCSDPSSL